MEKPVEGEEDRRKKQALKEHNKRQTFAIIQDYDDGNDDF